MELGVPLMDEDHAKLEAMIATVATTADDKLPGLREAILTEVGDHFAREEELMRRRSFPGLECHVREHRRLLDLLRRSAHEDALALRHTLSVVVPEIVEDHVDSLDYVTAMFLRGELQAA